MILFIKYPSILVYVDVPMRIFDISRIILLNGVFPAMLGYVS